MFSFYPSFPSIAGFAELRVMFDVVGCSLQLFFFNL